MSALARKTARRTDSSCWYLPKLKIELDAADGPLGFLGFVDRSRAEAVSRGFSSEVRTPSLWREITFEDHFNKGWWSENSSRPTDDYVVLGIIRRPAFGLITHLDLEDWNITDASLTALARCSRKVTYLNVSQTPCVVPRSLTRRCANS